MIPNTNKLFIGSDGFSVGVRHGVFTGVFKSRLRDTAPNFSQASPFESHFRRVRGLCRLLALSSPVPVEL